MVFRELTEKRMNMKVEATLEASTIIKELKNHK